MLATEAQGGGRTHGLVRAVAADWKFPCDDGQVAALGGYAESLLRWNERINLTAARAIDRLVAEHFHDAFALARRLEGPDRVVDVGSGGGLPAIPLALLRPRLTVELCEPIAKKAAFLRTAIRELGLGDRASVRTARGEALAKEIEKDPARAFDVAISRATLPPEKWLALAPRLVRPGGRLFVLTTPDVLPGLGDREIYDDGRHALIEVKTT
jgi:16S rRNA (guanine(527)-N(7))-methyltransferase RsmG